MNFKCPKLSNNKTFFSLPQSGRCEKCVWCTYPALKNCAKSRERIPTSVLNLLSKLGQKKMIKKRYINCLLDIYSEQLKTFLQNL